MKIKSFVFNPFYENTYLLWDDSLNAIIIDPGCYEKYEQKEILDFISVNNLEVNQVINTHCHIDHVLGNYFIKEHFKCPLCIPENEIATYESVTAYGPQWGIHNYTKAEPDTLLKEGQEISFGHTKGRIIEVPGHSVGHQVFYFEKEHLVIGGDVLFRNSIGRTDLPGGNHDQLIKNIKEKMYTLPEDTFVYPGHGQETTIKYEKSNNPFVKA